VVKSGNAAFYYPGPLLGNALTKTNRRIDSGAIIYYNCSMKRAKKSKATEQADSGPSLGDLESDVMSVVWKKGEATVQDVQHALQPHRPLAYTTVMTVMSRLAQKGFLNRRKEGRSYLYAPVPSQERYAVSQLRSLVQRLYEGATGKAIAHLLETDDNVSPEELERLEALIRARRQEKE
jgi:predicted transcriptional regulator